MKPSKKSRRHILLLEVLIAFALVVLCIFPLIAPHVFILKAQYEFNDKIILDQKISQFYAQTLEKIYKNEIPWSAFEQETHFPIEKEQLGMDAHFDYSGTYHFKIVRQKGKEKQPFNANVVTLTISLVPTIKQEDSMKSSKALNYEYRFFAAHLNAQQQEQPKEPDDKTNQPT